jgi:uncharacterized membrane protein YdjX (TVP38/TMEM64 family)
VTAATLRLGGRVLLLAAIVAGMAFVWLHRDAISPRQLQETLAPSPAAPAIYLLAHLVVSLVFIPRALIAAAAGLIFGLWWGLFWATVGCVLGSVLGFLVARYVNSGLVSLEAVPRFGPYLLRAETSGWRAVALIRVLPIMNHTFTNYAFGLTKVPLGAYALGSLVGQLPSTIAFVEFGAAGERAMSGRPDWLLPSAIGAAALILSLVLPRFVQQRMAGGGGPPVAQSSNSTVCTTGRAPE